MIHTWLLKKNAPCVCQWEGYFLEMLHILHNIYFFRCLLFPLKVAEDDIVFKLAIFKLSLHLNDNTDFFSMIQASKLVFGSLLAKNNYFVQVWTKSFASSRMANCGSGLPAEWPFRSQNAIEASDSPLPGGLWVKHLITHALALCSLAYSDIAWCKLFSDFDHERSLLGIFCLQNTT